MSKTLKLAFGAILATALIAPALAQDNFPDAPEYHWAYTALLNMKNEGILVGYPDGLFRGGRPASRYELAAAINSAYEKLKGMIGGLSSEIDAIKRILERGPGGGGATKEEVQALREALEMLRNDVNNMKKWGDDIAALKRMADMFEKDLAKMGVDVEAMKKDLGDLAERVGRLEKIKAAVEVHGDVNFVMHGGHSTDGLFGITVDGRMTGYGSGSYSGEPVGLTRDLNTGHEGAFTLSGTNDEGPKWHATVVIGNLLDPDFYGSQSELLYLTPFENDETTVYFQDLGVDFDTSVWGQNFTASLGRVGYKNSPMFFQRRDNTFYFNNPRWDNGLWYFDGGILKFKWGNVALDVFGGRQSGMEDSDDNEIWPMTVPSFDPLLGFDAALVDQHLGFNLGFNLGEKGHVLLNYIFLDTNTFASSPILGASFNRLAVFGGEVKYDISNAIELYGGWGQTNYQENSSNVDDEDNMAYWASVAWHSGTLNAGVGYRHIEAGYGAPGDWGRIGFYWNPVEIEGFHGNIGFQLNPKLWVGVNGSLYNDIDDTSNYWFDDSEMLTIIGELKYEVNQDWDLYLGVEHFKQSVDVLGDMNDPNVTWYRLGLTYGMDANSWLRFFYEMSDLDSDGNTFYTSEYGAERKGGLLTVQWFKKF